MKAFLKYLTFFVKGLFIDTLEFSLFEFTVVLLPTGNAFQNSISILLIFSIVRRLMVGKLDKVSQSSSYVCAV